jgi:hypothetical protein
MNRDNPIRVAMSALGQRIYAGRLAKDGQGFKEPRYDVTSDVFVAIRDKVGIGNEIEVGLAGTGVMFRIAVLPPRDSDQSSEAGETQSGSTEGASAGLVEASHNSDTPSPGVKQ